MALNPLDFELWIRTCAHDQPRQPLEICTSNAIADNLVNTWGRTGLDILAI